MTETLSVAGDRYERLYWALRAKKALGTQKTRDIYGATSRDKIPESAIVSHFKPTNRWERERIIYRPSTLRGERYMVAWEREALERQLAEAPSVTQDDVNRARKTYGEAKRATKAQLKLAMA